VQPSQLQRPHHPTAELPQGEGDSELRLLVERSVRPVPAQYSPVVEQLPELQFGQRMVSSQ
jgi:hypothetical protein